MIITVSIHGNQYFYYGFRDAVTLILGGGVIAIFIGAVFYPLYYYLEAGKIEIIAIISLIISIAIIAGISILINILVGDKGVSDITYYISLLVIVCITGLAYTGSCLLSCHIFQLKEY